jgi:predicted membrane channel-forming protein YqfA (hemolysin III family)
MIALILTLALLGLVVWLITTYIPMPAPFKTIIFIVAGICVVLYLMTAFGIVDLPIPRLR